jgi:hypothetical protein
MKKVLLTTLLAFACSLLAQQKADPPPFQVDMTWARSSSYEYRVVAEGKKEFLEMRQQGKKKWARVEDVTCTHFGRFESDSFDYASTCK